MSEAKNQRPGDHGLELFPRKQLCKLLVSLMFRILRWLGDGPDFIPGEEALYGFMSDETGWTTYKVRILGVSYSLPDVETKSVQEKFIGGWQYIVQDIENDYAFNCADQVPCSHGDYQEALMKA